MNGKQILLALLLTGASFATIYVLLDAEGEVRLIEVEESPRLPVEADASTKKLVLAGLGDKLPASGNELRKARNDLARRHREAIEAWRRGKVPLREVERIEQMLWVARHKTGEIDEPTLHRKLAELFGREHERLQILYERGLASRKQLDIAALYVARERYLAGEDVRDEQGRDYETMRREFLEALHVKNTALIDSGLGHREQLELELINLSEEFPPVVPRAVAPSAGAK